MTTPEESFETPLAPASEAASEPRLKFHWLPGPLTRGPLGLAAWLRSRIRASELLLVALAVGVGAGAGALSALVSFTAHLIQTMLYGLEPGQRLSSIEHLAPASALALPVGGLVLGLVTWAWMRQRPKSPVDPVEANALHGGRMSVRDSVFVGVQSVISNGFGASVGLEAAYAQLGAGLGSRIGQALRLRRSDLRAFVGAGAGAGIAAAFGAPLTGAFYAFEIIIGSYTVVNIAAVVAAAIAATWVSRALAIQPTVLHTSVTDSLTAAHYLMFAGVGVVSAVIGVTIMRLVAVTEHRVAALPGPRWIRPGIGGLILAALALADPHSLSAGHGAMAAEAAAAMPLLLLAFLILAKASASIVALGFGFRGGLFFASLYLGALVGKFLVLAADAVGFHAGIDPTASALVGMGAMAVAIIGGPFTMTFLVLETTGDFGMTAATLTASIIASLLVRETFGYSFSTWRLHLRGETIRSANDVSWLRYLTAARMMRSDAQMIPADMSTGAFRARFPLGSSRWVVGLDELGHYAGLIRVATAHAVEDASAPVGQVMVNRGEWLGPHMAIKEMMGVFDRTESDELAVVGDDHQVLGVVSEGYATRRYAEELEKARRELVGGD